MKWWQVLLIGGGGFMLGSSGLARFEAKKPCIAPTMTTEWVMAVPTDQRDSLRYRRTAWQVHREAVSRQEDKPVEQRVIQIPGMEVENRNTFKEWVESR